MVRGEMHYTTPVLSLRQIKKLYFEKIPTILGFASNESKRQTGPGQQGANQRYNTTKPDTLNFAKNEHIVLIFRRYSRFSVIR